MASRNQEQAIAALRAAGYEDAARMLESMSPQPEPGGVPAGLQPQPTTSADREAEAFAQQIREASQRGGGWVSTPLNAPIDDGGRF